MDLSDLKKLIEDDDTRRLAMVRVSPKLFTSFLKGKNKKCEVIGNKLPDDAKFISAHFDWSKQEICLIYESKEFEKVPEGHLIPVLDSLEIKSLEG